MRRTALAIGLLLVAAMATASPAVAQPTTSAPADVAADFNHDGIADLAVGVPGENGVAGAVNVLYGAGGGLGGTGRPGVLPGRRHSGGRRPVRVGVGRRGFRR